LLSRWGSYSGHFKSLRSSTSSLVSGGIPGAKRPQVRDFAAKSVDQAERAISSFMASASKSVAVVPSPMNDAAEQALAITEKNLKAAFEHARKLMNAKDIDEGMQLQTEFLRNQFGIATEQSMQMSMELLPPGEVLPKKSLT
jgi:hypothetical protein